MTYFPTTYQRRLRDQSVLWALEGGLEKTAKGPSTHLGQVKISRMSSGTVVTVSQVWWQSHLFLLSSCLGFLSELVGHQY